MSDNSTDVQTRVIWATLNCDPATPGSFLQKVSVPTEECPSGSSVGDHVWIFHPDLCAKLYLDRRLLDYNMPAGEGSLLDRGNEKLLLWSKRFMLAVMSRPTRNILHLGSIWNEFGYVRFLINFITSGPSKEGPKSLETLTKKDAECLVQSIGANWKSSNSYYKFELFVRRIQKYGQEGLTGDCLSLDTFRAMMLACKTRLSDAKHWSLENDRPSDDENDSVASPPLPDEYCRRLLKISDFYRTHLASHLILHAATYAKMRKAGTTADYAGFAEAYKWPVKSLPFEHHYNFPPKSWRQTSRLITFMQTANAEECLLFTGARTHELLKMKSNCLSKTGNGNDGEFLHSIRFKGSPSLSGKEVCWPIPCSVANAVKTQLKLSKELGVDGVWLSPRSLAHPLKDNLTPMLQRFDRSHKLDASNGGVKKVTVQRFRPTIARLVFLADGADPRLVKRVLGHRWMTTTISYLRMSPFIRQELNLNRYQKRDLDASTGETDAISVKAELTPQSLSAILMTIERQGRRLHVIGPGVFVSIDQAAAGAEATEAAVIDLDDTIAFIVDWMTRRSVRQDASLYRWLANEASRIAGGLHHLVTKWSIKAFFNGVSRMNTTEKKAKEFQIKGSEMQKAAVAARIEAALAALRQELAAGTVSGPVTCARVLRTANVTPKTLRRKYHEHSALMVQKFLLETDLASSATKRKAKSTPKRRSMRELLTAFAQEAEATRLRLQCEIDELRARLGGPGTEESTGRHMFRSVIKIDSQVVQRKKAA